MSNSTANTAMSETDILLASAIIFTISFSGVMFNVFAMITVLKSPILKNAFGALCFSHTVANFGVLFVFCVWVTPTTILQYDKTEETFGKVLGQINILFWNACCYSHLAISVNRFMAISMPNMAKHMFTLKPTVCLITFVWLMGIGHIIPYFWRDTCYTAYDPVSWTWVFPDTDCGYVITTYTDYYTSVAIFVAMSCLDGSTFILLICYHKKQMKGSTDEMKKRRKREIRFFTQSCLQGVLFFYEVFNFYYVTTLNTNHWFVFMTSTFAWELCHCLDGLVVVVFHFKRSFVKGFGSSVHNTRIMSKVSETQTMSLKRRASSIKVNKY